MKELLNNKVMIYFAIIGAVISFLFGLIAGVKFARLILQTLLSGIAFGGLGLGITVLVKKSIPEDSLNELLGKKESGEESTGNNVDMTDDTEMSADELYANAEENQANKEENQDVVFKIDEDEGELPKAPMSDGNSGGEGGSSKTPEFEETDFTESPKVSPSNSPTEENEEDLIKSEFNRMKERAKSGESVASGGGPTSSSPKVEKKHDGTFKIGNKKVSADPKVIAKAIKTVLSRD